MYVEGLRPQFIGIKTNDVSYSSQIFYITQKYTK